MCSLHAQAGHMHTPRACISAAFIHGPLGSELGVWATRSCQGVVELNHHTFPIDTLTGPHFTWVALDGHEFRHSQARASPCFPVYHPSSCRLNAVPRLRCCCLFFSPSLLLSLGSLVLNLTAFTSSRRTVSQASPPLNRRRHHQYLLTRPTVVAETLLQARAFRCCGPLNPPTAGDS